MARMGRIAFGYQKWLDNELIKAKDAERRLALLGHGPKVRDVQVLVQTLEACIEAFIKYRNENDPEC